MVAARDEVRHIAEAVTRLLAQAYPDFEVVVVDDRSTDGTGEVLDRLAAARAGAALRVLHLSALPDGWLGKTHALHRGAQVATGDLLLFTDGDVLMDPTAVRRAVALLERHGLDHLAVAPRLHSGSPWATLVVAVFLVLFSTFFRPWKARDPASRFAIGVGAFNLVRARAYRSIGGHRSVALRPDDDVRLGRALKRAGYRQEVAAGRRLLTVEWYPSLPAMARGLRKNAFAAVDYRLSAVVAGTVLAALFIVWPLVALFVTTGAAWWLNATLVVVAASTTGAVARGHGLPTWTGPAYPVGGALLLWIVWAATLRTLRTGTVEWRGTAYPLDQLRDR